MEATKPEAIFVCNNVGANRLEAHVQGLLATADYVLIPDAMVFTHTRVPDELSGRGIATQLIAAGLTVARERGLRVIARCSFVEAYIKKHPEVQDLLVQSPLRPSAK